MPKLQTGCATPVTDGMVVHTRSRRGEGGRRTACSSSCSSTTRSTARSATAAASARCRTRRSRSGRGESRFVEEKRHFEKPIPISDARAARPRALHPVRPLHALRRRDRRATRSIDFVDRGDRTQVIATSPTSPFVVATSRATSCRSARSARSPRSRTASAPGRGTSSDVGLGLHAVPGAVQRRASPSRRPRRARARRRLRGGQPRLALRQGPLRLPGDPRRRAHHRAAGARRRRAASGVRGRRALDGRRGRAAARRRAAPPRSSAARRRTRRASSLQHLLRDGLGSADVDSRAGSALDRETRRALAAPDLQATVPDLEYAHAVLVLDTEPGRRRRRSSTCAIRKGVRAPRRASSRRERTAGRARSTRTPSIARFAPGAGEAFARRARRGARGGGERTSTTRARAAGADGDELRAIAAALRDAGDDIVILWGERVAAGPRGAHAARALLNVARAPRPAGRDGAGLLQIPLRRQRPRPARGRRAAGRRARARRAPRRRARAAAADRRGRRRRRPHRALPARTPTRSSTSPTPPLGRARSSSATTVIAHAGFLTERLARARDRGLPRRVLRGEGGHGHPPRRAPPAPAPARSAAPARCAPSGRCSPSFARASAPTSACSPARMVTTQLLDAVPFYAGLTLDEIGGRGVRWQERERPPRTRAGARSAVRPRDAAARGAGPTAACASARSARSGPRPRSRTSPALQFLARASASSSRPADAARLGVDHGDGVAVGPTAAASAASRHVRADAPAGTRLPARPRSRGRRRHRTARSSRCAARSRA